MKIKLLSSALEDLSEGRLFYEKQGEGLGEYFFDSLFSDIDSLVLYGGIHSKVYGYHRILSKGWKHFLEEALGFVRGQSERGVLGLGRLSRGVFSLIGREPWFTIKPCSKSSKQTPLNDGCLA